MTSTTSVLRAKHLWLAATALVTSVPAALAAQTAETPATAAVADAGGGEIIVTGSRAATSGFANPSAVSVISTQAIQQQVRTTVADVLLQEPAFRGTRFGTRS